MHEMTVSRVFACFQIEDAKIILKIVYTIISFEHCVDLLGIQYDSYHYTCLVGLNMAIIYFWSKLNISAFLKAKG